MDLPFLLNHSAGAIGEPRLFTTSATRGSLRSRQHPLAARVCYIAEDLWQFCPSSLSWTLFSATAALILASYIGAQQVLVYGADFAADQPDYDGVNIAENRTAERFKLERGVWQKVMEWLALRGVEVKRIGDRVNQ